MAYPGVSGLAWIFGLEHYPAVITRQEFAEWFTIDSRDDDVARLCFDGAVNVNQVTGIDAGANHAVAFHTHDVNVRGSYVEPFVKRDALLQVIRCGRREAGWDVKGKERELRSARFEWAEDGDHDDNANTVYAYS